MNNPELYQQCNTLQRRDALACLEIYAPKLKWKKNNNKILDFGCGDGSVTSILEKFLPNDYNLLGCDVNENMVCFANKFHKNERKSFISLDIEGYLPEELRDNFDHVFSFFTLNWVIDQNTAFKNIFNMMEENGECFMIFVGYHATNESYVILSQNEKWSNWIQNIERYISPYHNSKNPDKEVMKLMKNVGFVDVHVECKDMVFTYENEVILKKHTLAVNPFKIPENMKDDFVKDCIQLLKDLEIRHKGNSNNCSKTVTLYYKLLIVYGRKPTRA